ncbi:MAG: NAD(P)H-binding protein [Pseudohongiellaceae bacterium]
MRIVITGANSSVGRNLLGHMAGQQGLSAVGVVRSSRAMASLPRAGNIQPVLCPYDDAEGLARAFEGADCIVHLGGVLFESRGSSYQQANVDSTKVVVETAKRAAVAQIVFISVLGAHAGSANAYFRSKGEAENLISASGLAATVIRTPILMSPDNAGGQALLRSASAGTAKVLGGGHYSLRPLDVDDLSRAILQVCRQPPAQTLIHELAGPEQIAYSDLIRLVAKSLGKPVRISSIPVWSARLLSWFSYRIKKTGMSPAIIEVITASESVSVNADRALGITLTPLSETIAKLIRKRH